MANITYKWSEKIAPTVNHPVTHSQLLFERRDDDESVQTRRGSKDTHYRSNLIDN